MNSWEHFAHGSDIGVRGTGATAAAAFEMAGLALIALMGDLDNIQEREFIEVTLQAPSLDVLFFDWINLLIYECATRKMLFSFFQVSLDLTQLTLHAHLGGEPVDLGRHHLGVEVKGATFTELKVVHQDNQWVCQCIVDV